MRHRALQVIVAALLAALPLVAAVAPARADNASALLGMVNALRAAHGAGPLYADPTLTRVAQGWSTRMASGYGLSHNPDVASQLSGGWTKLGENVGEGGNINAIFNAFVNSPFHFGNMIDPSYNLTGIAVAVGRLNTLWVTEDFEAKPGATPVPTRPPATTATTARPVATPPPAAPHVAGPTPTAPNTTPPTTAHDGGTTTTPGATSVVPGSDPTLTAPVPSAPDSTLAHRLATAAALFPHRSSGGSVLWLVLTLSGLGLAALGGAAYMVTRRLT